MTVAILGIAPAALVIGCAALLGLDEVTPTDDASNGSETSTPDAKTDTNVLPDAPSDADAQPCTSGSCCEIAWDFTSPTAPPNVRLVQAASDADLGNPKPGASVGVGVGSITLALAALPASCGKVFSCSFDVVPRPGNSNGPFASAETTQASELELVFGDAGVSAGVVGSPKEPGMLSYPPDAADWQRIVLQTEGPLVKLASDAGGTILVPFPSDLAELRIAWKPDLLPSAMPLPVDNIRCRRSN